MMCRHSVTGLLGRKVEGLDKTMEPCGQTPTEFAFRWAASGQAAPPLQQHSEPLTEVVT